MMKVSDFDYELPEELIAKHPPKIRGTSRLLALNRKNGDISDDKYANLVNYLSPGDVLVLNNTKVIKARLMTKRSDGAVREILILEKHGDKDDWHHHKVMYRGKIFSGDVLRVVSNNKAQNQSIDEVVVEEILGDGLATVKSNTDLLELAEKYGSPPLPPYLHRDATSDDVERYQTVFAKSSGSVAAPTASLNLTGDLLEKIETKGVIVKYITLHVGLGTFLPIRESQVEKHQIHSEYFEIPIDTAETIRKIKKSGKRVVAVGTTVARTLEFVASQESSDDFLTFGEANIYIYPGYEFKMVDALLTNYHAPRSTVLMLASAFAGKDNLQKAYQHAIKQKYQFLSYGDSMLIY